MILFYFLSTTLFNFIFFFTLFSDFFRKLTDSINSSATKKGLFSYFGKVAVPKRDVVTVMFNNPGISMRSDFLKYGDVVENEILNSDRSERNNDRGNSNNNGNNNGNDNDNSRDDDKYLTNKNKNNSNIDSLSPSSAYYNKMKQMKLTEGKDWTIKNEPKEAVISEIAVTSIESKNEIDNKNENETLL